MVHRAIVLLQRLVLDGGSELHPSTVALVRRSLVALARIGVTRVCLVDGEHADVLAAELAGDPELAGLSLEVLANTSWRRQSGAALLIARDFLTAESGPCLVLRGDRPLDHEALAELAATDLGTHRAAITVAEPPAADLSAEVRVSLTRTRGGQSRPAQVAGLALDLDDFDGVWTGHALVSPEVVRELDRFNNPALEDALAVWVARGRVLARPGRIAWPWGLPATAEVRDSVEAIMGSKAHPAYTLLNPGPVNTTAEVKSALVHRDVCHRDANFSELMVSLTGKLRRIFRGSPDHTVCVVTGSGTSAMECAISSVVPRDRKILVVDNGAFGERMLEIARLHEMDIVHLRYAWGDRVRAADVERAFEDHPDIAVVAMVHHETSVGLLEPGARGRPGVPADGRAVPGRRGVVAGRRGPRRGPRQHRRVLGQRQQVPARHQRRRASCACRRGSGQPSRSVKPRTYYLDLKRYRRYIDELAQTPFTPAVSAYFALDAAASEFLADGHRARLAMYRARNQRMRDGLAALGMAPLTRTGFESHSVTTCCVPAGIRVPGSLQAAQAARLHRLRLQGRPGRAVHAGGQHGRPAARAHRRVPAGHRRGHRRASHRGAGRARRVVGRLSRAGPRHRPAPLE